MTNDQERPASPYAGRWVARLQGKVIAQGSTAEEARPSDSASQRIP